MAEQEVEQCDVAVIGGGPGGSTAAALLARRGYKVIALEKAHHPRFHIGESLLPMNLPVFERLGVLDKVRELGVFKPGADFEADNARGYNTYAFARAIGQSPPHAYQVWRQDFDRMLYGHARESGADAREGHEVLRVEQRGPRESWLDVRTDDGRDYAIQARYVVDASGRDALLATKRKLRRRNDQHQSAAIFGHFRGAARREGEDAGNISIYSFAHGWMWLIPLPDGVMSVGAVLGGSVEVASVRGARTIHADDLYVGPLDCDVLDLSVEDIADGLSVSEGTVKTSLHRARASLAPLLSDSMSDEYPAISDAQPGADVGGRRAVS